MEILKFTLKGSTAFFKKPDVNTYTYFSYGNIHKVALMGLFGAVMGLNGYNQMAGYEKQKEKLVFPEFYSVLKDLKVSIVPSGSYKNGNVFSKKIQVFNNTVGYASQEQGGILVVKEQWLFNPEWDIYILIDTDVAKKLKDMLVNRQCVYIPYLGKNDHMADIDNVICYEDMSPISDYNVINSLCIKDKLVAGIVDDDDDDDSKGYSHIFKYEEKLPCRLEETTNMYEVRSFVCSNLPVGKYDGDVYSVNGKNIVFY